MMLTLFSKVSFLKEFIMAQAMLQASATHNVRFLYEKALEREKIQAFAIAQNALLNALHHIRSNQGDLLRAMANTRRALDAIREMRELID
jgi:hypothetical protein